MKDMLAEAAKLESIPEPTPPHCATGRAWQAEPLRLSPEEVVRRSAPRPGSVACRSQLRAWPAPPSHGPRRRCAPVLPRGAPPPAENWTYKRQRGAWLIRYKVRPSIRQRLAHRREKDRRKELLPEAGDVNQIIKCFPRCARPESPCITTAAPRSTPHCKRGALRPRRLVPLPRCAIGTPPTAPGARPAIHLRAPADCRVEHWRAHFSRGFPCPLFRLRVDPSSTMVTFPVPSLKFRTVGFPEYGFKAGLSDGAFLQRRVVKSAPDIPTAPRSLHPSFVHPVVPTTSRTEPREPDSVIHRHASNSMLYPRALAPVRVMLSRSIHA